MLVGGLGAGGPGYYALDVSDPLVANETAAAAKVLWEFPNAPPTTGVRANIGYSFGKPVIVKTRAAGWVVLVTSGLQQHSGDGQRASVRAGPNSGQVHSRHSHRSGL